MGCFHWAHSTLLGRRPLAGFPSSTASEYSLSARTPATHAPPGTIPLSHRLLLHPAVPQHHSSDTGVPWPRGPGAAFVVSASPSEPYGQNPGGRRPSCRRAAEQVSAFPPSTPVLESSFSCPRHPMPSINPAAAGLFFVFSFVYFFKKNPPLLSGTLSAAGFYAEHAACRPHNSCSLVFYWTRRCNLWWNLLIQHLGSCVQVISSISWWLLAGAGD